MYQSVLKFIALIAASLLLVACESKMFTKKPVTSVRVIADEQDAMFTAVSIDTDRRILIIDERDKTVCGEPSPEALETYSSNFSDDLGVAVRKGKIDTESAMALAAMYDNSVDNMVPHTQGIKFGRDQLYFLCLSRQNAYITNDQYLELFREVVTQSAKLVALEIPTLRNASQVEVVRLRDYLKTSLETGEDLADAMAENAERRREREEEDAGEE